MPHTLLLVHGMGTPDDAMFARWTGILSEQYAKCVDPSMGTFEEQFNLIHVNYDSVFSKMRQQWNQQIAELLPLIPGGKDGPVSADDLKGITKDNFFTTHLMDVILYRFSDSIARTVRYTVAKAIMDAIAQETQTGGKVSILAHSLGTSVVHDTLNEMFYTDMKIPDPLGGGTFRQLQFKDIHFLAQIANVSRLLETKYDAYKPAVRPSKVKAEAVAAHMLSASHAWDPLVSLRRFSPDEGWPDEETWRTGRFKLVESGRIAHWNVHDFGHYMRDPFVYLPFFKALFFKEGMVGAAEQRELRRKYIEDNPIENFNQERNALKELVRGEAEFSWKALINVFKGFAEAAKKFTA